MRKITTGCTYPGCDKPHRSKGFCRSHYRSLTGESSRRWQKIKSDESVRERVKDSIKRYKSTSRYKELRKTHDEKYVTKNRKKVLKYKKEWNEIKRFGVKRETIMWRDGGECALCTRKEDLVIHHKNGLGRCTDNPDNNPKNLITVCRSCHIKIHGPRGIINI